MTKAITSRENEYFRLARSLGTSKGIRETGFFIIEGPKMLGEALQTDMWIHSVTVDNRNADKYSDLIHICEEKRIPAYTMPDAMITQVCNTETSQGLFALVKAPSFTLPDGLDTLGNRVVALDGVQDPGNMGTILRCAAAFACSAVLLGAGCAHPLNAKVIRSCMGAIFRIQIYENENLPQTLERLSCGGYEVIAGHLAGTIERPRLPDKAVLVIGNESRGISAEVAAKCTTLWRLNMPGKMESLNASVAAGIMMYELFTQTD